MSLKKILTAINENKKFLISSHVNLEGDAICSELALSAFLKSKGKAVQIINESEATSTYKFLPNIKSLSTKIRPIDFDVACILDSSDLGRIGKVAKLIKLDMLTINIDHHMSNDEFADINWVKTDTSSTTEMVYDLFKKTDFKINKDIALLLYVGIMTDTGSFRYSNTTENTHMVIADLLKWKLPVNEIYQKIYESNPASDVRLFIELINNFKLDQTGRISWLTIKHDALGASKSQIDIGERILGFLRSIEGVEVCVFLRELKDKNQTRVNFRSQGKINVGKIAMGFGGGGHKSASGCTIGGNLKDVENLVIAKLKKILR